MTSFARSTLAYLTGLLAIFLPLVNLMAADPLVGSWIREGDNYEGWVVEVTQQTDVLEARSHWVPMLAQIAGGFQIGEKKIREIRKTGEGEYTCENMSRGDDGISFDSNQISMPSRDRMIMISDRPTGRLGDRQRWRRIPDDSPLVAYVYFGRAMLAQERERIADAARFMEMAAQRLLKNTGTGRHADLANDIAWQLATSAHQEIRKPALALKLLPLLGDWFEHTDTAAAVYAANGDFTEAIASQTKALQLINRDDYEKMFLREYDLNSNNLILRLRVIGALSNRRRTFEARLRLYEERRAYLQDERTSGPSGL